MFREVNFVRKYSIPILRVYVLSLFIFSAPPVIIKPEKTTIIGDRSGTVELECPAIGNPRPTITWHKNRRSIAIDGTKFRQKKTGALVINSLLPLDSGTYLCTAKNPTGQDFLILTLYVYSKSLMMYLRAQWIAMNFISS